MRKKKISIDKVQEAFNSAIKRRDKRCMIRDYEPCCGQLECSHYYTVGSSPSLRFYPPNAYTQCQKHHRNHHNKKESSEVYGKWLCENPWKEQTYLKANFLKVPDVVDMNRMTRGDYYKKPTAYWFWNCKPTNGFSYQNDKEQKTIMKAKMGIRAGICSEERSMISPDYARNWICDFVLGKRQKEFEQPTLFDFY